MANEIRIQPASTELVRGQKLIVPVTVVIDQPLKVRGIHALFWGAEETKAEYTTTSTNSKGHVQTHRHTAVQYSDVVKQEHVLSGNAKLGFFGNLSDAVSTIFGGGKHSVIQVGEYPFEIEIGIPEDAPPSHAGKKSRVFYELSVQVDVPLGRDLKNSQSFSVRPMEDAALEPQPVRTRYPEDEGRGFFDSVFSPDVKIEMAVTADRYQVGDPIDGIVIVNASKPLKCNAVRVRLVGLERTHAQGHSDQHWHPTEAVELARPGMIDGNWTQEFALTAATNGPVSMQGQRFSIDWFVQVELDVPWAKDPAVRAPIILRNA